MGMGWRVGMAFRRGLCAGLAAIALVLVASLAPAQTLQAVKARGALLCGVNEGLPGFANLDQSGQWTGFDVDFCRALAAAIFGDPSHIRLVPLTAEARFQALKDGKIDVLSRNSTWTMGREVGYELAFVGVTYYDGQGFMAPRAMRVSSALDLDGAAVCVLSGTTTIDNLADFFSANHMALQTVAVRSTDEWIKAYDSGVCNVATSDLSQLYALRQRLSHPRDHVILPDVISKEPLGPVVRQNDPNWIEIVRWVHFAMVDAEELGVGQRNVGDAMRSQKPEVMRLVGTAGDFGADLGLGDSWAANVIRAVGNYGESFDRNLGVHSPLAIPRGLNQLWNEGGIQYAPPIR
jgi:general L-amino acid transport system substrate-binding protein